MKSLGPWVGVFLVLLALAYGVDDGEVKLGIPVFFWLAINLTLFLYLLARFVGRPVSAFLENRRETIGSDLRQAEERLAEARRLKEDVLERLSKVEAEVDEIRKNAEDLGRQEAERIAEEGRTEADRLVRRVGEEITRKEAEMRDRLAKETARLTAELARTLLEERMTDEDRKTVLGRSIGALQAPGREG